MDSMELAIASAILILGSLGYLEHKSIKGATALNSVRDDLRMGGPLDSLPKGQSEGLSYQRDCYN